MVSSLHTYTTHTIHIPHTLTPSHTHILTPSHTHILPHSHPHAVSFYTSHDTGFEAFFTDTLVLVVATVTKKDFITVALKELSLTPNKWVCQTGKSL